VFSSNPRGADSRPSVDKIRSAKPLAAVTGDSAPVPDVIHGKRLRTELTYVPEMVAADRRAAKPFPVNENKSGAASQKPSSLFIVLKQCALQLFRYL
jgi:hypothetical protein